MKIILKTTKGEQFPVDVEESSTIYNIKEKVLELKQIAIEDQKLVHKGKMHADEKTVLECNIKDGDSIVITSTQKKAPTSTKPEVVNQQQPVQDQSAQQNRPQQQQQQQQPQQQPAQIQQQQAQDPEYLANVEQIVGMGFPKEKVERALQAAFRNPDRAIEYLLNDNIPSINNLGGIPGQGGDLGGVSGGEDDQEDYDEGSMDPEQLPAEINQIMNDPMFVQLRNTIRQNPQLLQPILQQIQASSPDMFNIIQMFPQVLTGNPGQQGTGGQQQPPQHNPHQVQIHITQEDKEALDRLQGLGFGKQDCLEAYLACGRDENAAVNYLLEESEKGDLLSQHIRKEQQQQQQQQQQPVQQQQQQQQQQPPQNPPNNNNNQGGNNNNNNNNGNNQGQGGNGGTGGTGNNNDDNIFD